ncbi:MAG: CBS domain-containing protein [Gammaproteobacteria bacterium]|nr:CBS domain-containing protein [Gammaproteobacteria bacterium]
MHIGAIVASKGGSVHTIEPHRTLSDAVDRMLALRVSSLLILEEDGRAAGIITEHDVIRALQRQPDAWKSTRVDDVMTRDLFTASPEHELGEVIAAMTGRHIRHLPVVNGGRVAGVLSIRDLIRAAMEELARHNEMMKRYIREWPESGETPG